MLEINVDTRSISSALDAAPGQLKYATSQAINRTAWDVRDELKKEMPAVFNKDGKPPTPFTLNSLKVFTSKQSNLTAEINFKGKPSDHYLRPEVFGGPRPLKIFEKALGGSFYVPGKAAPIDRYGNVTGSQIMRMLSVLGKARPGQNQSAAKRKIRVLKGIKQFYFTKEGHVAESTSKREPKIWFVKLKNAPGYSIRLRFNQVSKRVIDAKLEINTRKAISMAFKRAGL